MKEVDNPQYQHNGKGTAILSNKNLKMQPTRRLYNNEKMASCIIHKGDRKDFDG